MNWFFITILHLRRERVSALWLSISLLSQERTRKIENFISNLLDRNKRRNELAFLSRVRLVGFRLGLVVVIGLVNRAEGGPRQEGDAQGKIHLFWVNIKYYNKLLKIVDDSESEDENRVVKSEKDKRFDEMRELIKKSKNTRKNNDLNAAMNHFIDLTKGVYRVYNLVKIELFCLFEINV